MSGVFISYNRNDGALARRMTLALRALDVDVWWDQDMPSVVWREEIARRIGELAAVVVLWSPRSRGSDSVHDEALLGHDAKRLVNLLFELDKPPPPFHRVNGLPFDGWEGVVPHEGWRRLIATLDPMLAASGASAPGALVERLASQQAEFAKRQREIERAGDAIDAAKTECTRAERRAAVALAALDKADAQVEALRTMGASRAVIAAAHSEAERADTAKCDAEADVARALADVEEAGCKRDALLKGFETWVKEQGGGGRSAPTITVESSKPKAATPIPPAPSPPPTYAIEPPPPVGPETIVPDPDPLPIKPPDPEPKENWWIIGGVIAMFVVVMAWAFWPDGETGNTAVSTASEANSADSMEASANAMEAAADNVGAAMAAADNTTATSSTPLRNWLIGTWGIGSDCESRIIVRSTADGGLSFEQRLAGTGPTISRDTIQPFDDTTIVTGSATYVAAYPTVIARALGVPSTVSVMPKDSQFRSYMLKRCSTPATP